jgi:hypothetical protein
MFRIQEAMHCFFFKFFKINIYFQEAFSQSDFQKGPERSFRLLVFAFPANSFALASRDNIILQGQ